LAEEPEQRQGARIVSWLTLYLLLLKATLTSFSGLASLPMVHQDFVVEHHVLTERDLNAAVVAGRAVPGPNGLYIVSVGYLVGGIPGAIAGWLAMTTPAFLIIPLLLYFGQTSSHPLVRRGIEGVIIAAAGLIAAATIPLARDALTGPVTIVIASASLALVLFTKRDTLWILAGSALAGLLFIR
jgi:chromate transporter